MSDVTRMLEAVRRGESGSTDLLMELVYEELRRIAAGRMARERPGQTLQPTALVHEAWLRLAHGSAPPDFANRAHFFAAAAEAMRRILVDRARRRNAQRRGGGQEHVDLEGIDVAAPAEDEELLAVHEALDRFAAHSPAKCELVKLRFFAGLTIQEAAGVLQVSEPTAKRWWTYARAWLYREIGGTDPSGT
jgi:RNA polymerase sigma factor (TIGR02999 family)